MGCKEVFEADLANSRVTPLLPQNNTGTTVQLTKFIWSQVDEATKYTLEVVSPRFDSVLAYVYDTTVATNQVSLPLSPGEYQWRVKASNFSSQTPFTTPRNLQIDSTSDLSVQTVVLTSPSNQAASAKTTLEFTWNGLFTADAYKFVLYSGSVGGTPLLDTIVTGTSLQYTSLNEGAYAWAVKAMNAIPSETSFSSRTFEIDYSAPEAATPVSPDGATFATDSVFAINWNTIPDTTGSYQTIVKDSILIATDSSFNSIYTVKVSTTTSTTAQIFVPATYYWTVIRFDAAGNSSGYTTFKSFEVQ